MRIVSQPYSRLRKSALGPGLGGGEMAPLALGAAADRRFGRAERVDHLRMIAAKTADHVKHRDSDAAQNEGRVARERRLESADRIPGQAVVIGEGAIERLRRTRASRRASSPVGLWPSVGSLALRRARPSRQHSPSGSRSKPALDRASSPRSFRVCRSTVRLALLRRQSELRWLEVQVAIVRSV